jgi:hypothetical protein
VERRSYWIPPVMRKRWCQYGDHRPFVTARSHMLTGIIRVPRPNLQCRSGSVSIAFKYWIATMVSACAFLRVQYRPHYFVNDWSRSGDRKRGEAVDAPLARKAVQSRAKEVVAERWALQAATAYPGCRSEKAKHRRDENVQRWPISTGYLECWNLMLRMSQRRFTQRTNGFAMKRTDYAAAVGLYACRERLRRHRVIAVSSFLAAAIGSSRYSARSTK